MEGILFVVLHHYMCDDMFYGYNEGLHSVYPTWEQAKESVDSFLAENKNSEDFYDGVDGEPFITIVEMKWADTKRKTLYNTTDHERKKQREIEDAKKRKKEREERRKEKKGF